MENPTVATMSSSVYLVGANVRVKLLTVTCSYPLPADGFLDCDGGDTASAPDVPPL